MDRVDVMGEDKGYEYVEVPNKAPGRDVVFWILAGLVLVLLLAFSLRLA